MFEAATRKELKRIQVGAVPVGILMIFDVSYNTKPANSSNVATASAKPSPNEPTKSTLSNPARITTIRPTVTIPRRKLKSRFERNTYAVSPPKMPTVSTPA